ncbi:MAG: phosphodiester glycosidase family protein [Trueperaceae bacterium]
MCEAAHRSPGLIKLSAGEAKLGHVIRLAPLLTAVLLAAAALGLSVAQTNSLYRLPDDSVRFSGEAVTVTGELTEDTFIAGLGWLSGSPAPAPVRDGTTLYLDSANLDRLGFVQERVEPAGELPVPDRSGAEQFGPWEAPFTASVRFGGDSEIRVVVDLPQLNDTSSLLSLERQGRLDEGQPLLLDLPELILPPEQPDPYHGVDVTLLDTPQGTRFELRGPALGYRIFALENPTRLVVDVIPLREKQIATRTENLMEGVVYRTFGAATPTGESLVHLLEISPGAGEFRVVGTSEVARTLSELADGAFAAINAGYFDTRTFQAIGLLRVDYGLQSLPSRNRASIGFGFTGPVMTRVTALVHVRVGGRVYHREAPVTGEGVQVHTVGGALVGSPRKGALVAQQGTIVANRVGPVLVPHDGFVVVYPPEDRDLALIDAGSSASISVDFEPDSFQAVRYAVEAGPLLVANATAAFNPDLEAFSRGQRILDAYTQQSAIGIRPDGTVLFLVADDMRAEDLVPLFLSLGASEAMRLDSGSSATLMVAGKVLNRANERRIVSAIVFLPGT